MIKPFCVVIDIEAETCLGVDFFENIEKMRRAAIMYKKDSEPGCVILEYPSQEQEMLDAILTITESNKRHSGNE